MNRRRRGYRQLVEADLNIMPLMNLFVVLIPMLLLSAVFVEISSIDMDLPSADSTLQTPPPESLQLRVLLDGKHYEIRGRNLRPMVIDRNEENPEDALSAALGGIAEEHPGEREIRIVSQPNTRYQEIITVMDISREAGLEGISLAENSAN